MEGTMMFALTPRAGRWNHRFLVPVASRWSQQTLSDLADEASACGERSEIIATKTDVVQKTTGRKGEEWLIIKDDRLASLNETQRREIQRALDERAQYLETVVTETIDWDNEGSELVVERLELSNWLRDVEELIEKSFEDETETSRISDARLPVFYTIVALIGLCLIGTIVWQIVSGPGKSGTDSGKSHGQSPLPAKASDSPICENSLSVLTKLLGISSLGSNREIVEPDIGRKLEELFSWPVASETHARRSEQSITETADRPRVPIEKSLQLLYQFRFGQETLDSADELLNNEGFRQTLEKLYPSPIHGLDPVGLLPEDHQMTNELRKMDAVAFRQITHSIAGIQKIGPQKVPQGTGKYAVLFRDIVGIDTAVLRQFRETPELPTPCFFLDEDANLALAIKNLFTGTSFAKLLPEEEDIRNRQLVEITTLIGAEHTKGHDHLLSKRRLTLKLQEVDGDAMQTFRLLNQLIRACRLAAENDTTAVQSDQ